MCRYIIKILKLVAPMHLIIIVGVSFMVLMPLSSKERIKITITPALYSNNESINKFIAESEIDYIGVFEYEYNIDKISNTIQKECSYKKDFCLKQDNIIAKYELNKHIQDECYYVRIFHDIGSYVSCPIIVNSKLRGYAVVGSTDIMIQSEIEYYSRTIAENISQNTHFLTFFK